MPTNLVRNRPIHHAIAVIISAVSRMECPTTSPIYFFMTTSADAVS